MLTWIVRVVLIVAALIAARFVDKGAPGFASVQMTIATLLVTAFIAAAAFWPVPRKRRDADKPR